MDLHFFVHRFAVFLRRVFSDLNKFASGYQMVVYVHGAKHAVYQLG